PALTLHVREERGLAVAELGTELGVGLPRLLGTELRLGLGLLARRAVEAHAGVAGLGLERLELGRLGLELLALLLLGLELLEQLGVELGVRLAQRDPLDAELGGPRLAPGEGREVSLELLPRVRLRDGLGHGRLLLLGRQDCGGGGLVRAGREERDLQQARREADADRAVDVAAVDRQRLVLLDLAPLADLEADAGLPRE